MKDYENTKLLSENCMVNRGFGGLTGGSKYLTKKVDSILITHINGGKVILDREEALNLKLFLDKAFEQEF